MAWWHGGLRVAALCVGQVEEPTLKMTATSNTQRNRAATTMKKMHGGGCHRTSCQR